MSLGPILVLSRNRMLLLLEGKEDVDLGSEGNIG